jgi:hypothetical protein
MWPKKAIKGYREGGSDPAEGEKKVGGEEVDVKECYRRRRVHSAGAEEASSQEVCGGGLYLWAPGPKSLGDRAGSAWDFVSDVGSLLLEMADG